MVPKNMVFAELFRVMMMMMMMMMMSEAACEDLALRQLTPLVRIIMVFHPCRVTLKWFVFFATLAQC